MDNQEQRDYEEEEFNRNLMQEQDEEIDISLFDDKWDAGTYDLPIDDKVILDIDIPEWMLS